MSGRTWIVKDEQGDVVGSVRETETGYVAYRVDGVRLPPTAFFTDSLENLKGSDWE